MMYHVNTADYCEMNHLVSPHIGRSIHHQNTERHTILHHEPVSPAGSSTETDTSVTYRGTEQVNKLSYTHPRVTLSRYC
ncbi:hypothetical protein RRG08_040378 [Elysia crispata]|uniref:Uncharacterized protein n=1 Tax=Elysia crispata TaxID=231223 RepID=A0AAE1DRI6_9GAST|nr:hypothetical protein RRG08_040378 [Elysia crispata]